MPDTLEAVCANAKTFPKNILRHGPSFYASSLYDQLNKHDALFCDASSAELDLSELSNGSTVFWSRRIKAEDRLRAHLGLSTSLRSHDPRCRFLFVHAINGSSRQRLQISRDMLMLCFSRFHAMPEFVEFLFSFGYQSHARDPFFSAFHQKTHLTARNGTFAIPELAWSGREIQVCYNLKAAEPSGSESQWSIRDCAIHHTWDLENIRADWIIIKGNDWVRRRIEEQTGAGSGVTPLSFETLDRAFAASLATHLLLCEWAFESWRWYIQSLESQIQNTSRRTLTAPVTVPQTPKSRNSEFHMPSRTNTQRTYHSVVPGVSRISTVLSGRSTIDPEKQKIPEHRSYVNPDTGLSQPLPPHITVHNQPEAAPEQPKPNAGDPEDQDFSFSRLQKIQHVQEKAHETLLIIRLNMSIISQLKQYYHHIFASANFPQDVFHQCHDDIEVFGLRLAAILDGLQMYTLRSILEYQNTENNKTSTKNMITMTEDMNDIARKTKIETVSMKAITVVTLFFLPGTFISVCLLLVHTLMSTDIFQSQSPKRSTPDPYAHLTPLQLYLAASLPLTLVTILVNFKWHLTAADRPRSLADASSNDAPPAQSEQKYRYADPSTSSISIDSRTEGHL
ncbi:MAG: hypothetical protein Q9220_002076 [cf. Caloplaca sp. 1 TL-2023]